MKIGVLGAGAWGTALAQMLASDGREVLLWAREPELIDEINAAHTNSLFLPSATLAQTIRATGDLADMAPLDALLVVTPAQHMAAVLGAMPAHPRDLVLCSKGIEAGTGRLMNEVASEAAPSSQIAVLSGPTFAHEVANGLPTAVTLACGGGEAQWDRLSSEIARPLFRPYYSEDVTGAEIGGAVKNVLAIACGVVDGLGLGQNARAALIARGYAEMLRFGEALGAERGHPLRPMRARRPRPHLFLDVEPQLQPRQGAGRRRRPHGADGRPTHGGRRRVYRARPDRACRPPRRRDADRHRGLPPAARRPGA